MTLLFPKDSITAIESGLIMSDSGLFHPV